MPDHDLKTAIAAAAEGVDTPPFSVIRRRDARNRRRRNVSLGLIATGALAVVAIALASKPVQPVTGGSVAAVPSAATSSAVVASGVPALSGTQAAASVNGVPLLPKGPDPRSGQPFATAAQASAAGGGFYVPECSGHTDYFLQPNGAVVTLFQGNDSQLWVYPPGGPFISGPIQGNSVVTPQKLVVQGQPAYGYEATPKFVQLTPTHAEFVLVRSYLTWTNHGSSLELSSAADLSLSQLEGIANSCT